MKILGIDLGNTIVGNRTLKNRFYVEPRCFEIISNLNKVFDKIYIISRVNEEQKENSLKWLKEVNFFKLTGLDPNNLYYCWDRRDKALFAKALNVNYFIDDRASVLYHLDSQIIKFLFNPEKDDLEKHRNKLTNTTIVKNWNQIEDILDNE